MGGGDKELMKGIDATMGNKQLNVRLLVFDAQPAAHFTSEFAIELGDYPFVSLVFARLPSITAVKESYIKLLNVCCNKE